MRKLPGFFVSLQARRALAIFFGILAFAAGAAAIAIKVGPPRDNICIVCHKKTTTLTLGCNSLDYLSHKDHKDPDGPCSASQ